MKRVVADQEMFETKLLRTLLTRYRQSCQVSKEEVEHVDTLLKLSYLPSSVRFGSHRQLSKATLGGLLNSFAKSEVAVKLRGFWNDPEFPVELDEPYAFIFAIPTSTAQYVIVPGECFPVELCEYARFVSYIKFENKLVAITRLDDYLDHVWPKQDKEYDS